MARSFIGTTSGGNAPAVRDSRPINAIVPAPMRDPPIHQAQAGLPPKTPPAHDLAFRLYRHYRLQGLQTSVISEQVTKSLKNDNCHFGGRAQQLRLRATKGHNILFYKYL